MNDITVIYDGQCELCRNAITWVNKKVEINSVDFHSAELSQYSLTKEQCSREVFVICGESRWNGAEAVAFLLKVRGNKFLAALITAFGPFSRSAYRWIASNRNSIPVKFLARLLR